MHQPSALAPGLVQSFSVGSSKELEFGECSMLTKQMKYVGVCIWFVDGSLGFVERV